MTAELATRRPSATRQRWLPRQHGAWAMLLLPLLVGVAAASRPSPWHLVLGGAALSAYLASATIQAWSRGRRAPEYRAPILVYGGAFLALGAALVVAFPALAAVALVAGPASIIVLGGARPGTRRDLANSLAQVAQALVLVPAAAYVAGDVEWPRVATATAVAAAYLVGTVLVVRSVLRERGNERFAAVSAAFHVAATVAAVAWLPPAYGLLGVALTARAMALPVVQRRRAATPRPLRPIHVGLVEIAASVAVVAVAFAAPV
ncbi:MAG TPA: YwiC-like family protein [Candidatus Limnocylindrales bacterium]|nr:YwiC-like family protein [Candidatus Limnocylindrales bacterium]